MTEQALVPMSQYFVSPVASLEALQDRRQAIYDVMKKAMKRNLDYGVIPGTDKPTLLLPGAQKLATFFGLIPKYEEIGCIEDWTGAEHGGKPLFYYRFRCILWRGDMRVGEGEGACSSWERKYYYRKQERTCPVCGAQAIIRNRYDGGWLCWRKKDGCGAKFRSGDPAVEEQEVDTIPNPDIPDLVNTILKMAQKRAYIQAVSYATGASEFFTQDVEDFPDIVEAEYVEDEQPAKPVPKTSGREKKSAPGGTVRDSATPIDWRSGEAAKRIPAIRRLSKIDNTNTLFDALEAAPNITLEMSDQELADAAVAQLLGAADVGGEVSQPPAEAVGSDPISVLKARPAGWDLGALRETVRMAAKWQPGWVGTGVPRNTVAMVAIRIADLHRDTDKSQLDDMRHALSQWAFGKEGVSKCDLGEVNALLAFLEADCAGDDLLRVWGAMQAGEAE